MILTKCTTRLIVSGTCSLGTLIVLEVSQAHGSLEVVLAADTCYEIILCDVSTSILGMFSVLVLWFYFHIRQYNY